MYIETSIRSCAKKERQLASSPSHGVFCLEMIYEIVNKRVTTLLKEIFVILIMNRTSFLTSL